MDISTVALLKEYGPWAMGWPIAFWLIVRNTRIQDARVAEATKFTEAVVGMTAAMNALKDAFLAGQAR